MSEIMDAEETIARLRQPFMFVALASTVCEQHARGMITDETARQQMRFLFRNCPKEEVGGVSALWRGLDERKRIGGK